MEGLQPTVPSKGQLDLTLEGPNNPRQTKGTGQLTPHRGRLSAKQKIRSFEAKESQREMKDSKPPNLATEPSLISWSPAY